MRKTSKQEQAGPGTPEKSEAPTAEGQPSAEQREVDEQKAEGRKAVGANVEQENEAAGSAPEAASDGTGEPAEEPQEVTSLLETSSREVKQLLEAADDAAQKIREAAQAEAEGEGKRGFGNDEVSSLVEGTSSEVRQVLETADEAAEKIREEARTEARQLMDDARRRAEAASAKHVDRVARATEDVLGELASVRDHVQRLRDAFERAIEAMRADLRDEQSEVWKVRRNGVQERSEEAAELRHRLGRRRRTVLTREPEGISEGARLLALQQLTAGVDPEVIAQRLQNEFGIENPGPLLDWLGLQAGRHKHAQNR